MEQADDDHFFTVVFVPREEDLRGADAAHELEPLGLGDGVFLDRVGEDVHCWFASESLGVDVWCWWIGAVGGGGDLDLTWADDRRTG